MEFIMNIEDMNLEENPDTNNNDSKIQNDEPTHKKITVIQGNVDELDISKVYTNIDIERPEQNSPKRDNIIGPPNNETK